MCNFLHNNSKPIKESGIGWKLFSVDVYNRLHPLCVGNQNTYIVKEGKVSWRGRGDGFCFFLDKKEANKAKKLWQEASIGYMGDIPDVLLKIKYSQGLGEHLECSFISDTRIKIALCKEFTINPDEKNYTL